MSGGRRVLLAGLFDAVEAETPYGGRSVTYESVGSVWLRLGSVRRRQRAEAAVSTTIETVAGDARIDARLTVDRLLRFDGADWRIISGEAVGGRTALNLERTR